MSTGDSASGGEQLEGAAEELHRAALDATFTGFFSRHQPTVLRFLSRLESDRGLVEDVVQEAFLATRAKWADVQSYGNPLAWVIAVARKILSTNQAKRGRRPTVFLDDAVAEEIVAPTDAREADELLAGWLRTMQPRLAAVWSLSQEGWPDREIALTLGLSHNTVRGYKAEARSKLQQLAQDAGFCTPAGRRRR
jgi:RNA polymerase sigma-70 factor (ECF subfamily)